jgi:hypothetical protein
MLDRDDWHRIIRERPNKSNDPADYAPASQKVDQEYSSCISPISPYDARQKVEQKKQNSGDDSDNRYGFHEVNPSRSIRHSF